jgi:hypothetical protein
MPLQVYFGALGTRICPRFFAFSRSTLPSILVSPHLVFLFPPICYEAFLIQDRLNSHQPTFYGFLTCFLAYLLRIPGEGIRSRSKD